MNTVQLGERIAELAARINIATHEMLTLVAEFDRREGWADTFDSCAEWLAWRTGRTVATCRENVRVAHALEDLPKTSAAMKAGQLSYAKARAITRVATPETEGKLLEYADKGSAAAVERMVRERLEPEAGAVLMRAVEGGRSELDGVRVSAETSRRMACDASLVSMLHRGGKVVSVGRKTRTIPPHIRRALEERDRGCRYPGCGGRFTEAHHVRHWADGGETSLANTVLLCRRHHRLVHEGRVRMALDRLGQAVFFARSGGMIASAPPLPEPTLPLPPPPPLGPGEMYNGAARLVDSAILWEIEAAVREAVEAAWEAEEQAGGATAGDAPAFPRQIQGHRHVRMGHRGNGTANPNVTAVLFKIGSPVFP